MQRSLSTQPQRPRPDETALPNLSQEYPLRGFGIFYVLFFLSGLCALIYEVVWTRRLTLIFGITIYSISTVLVAYMGGLACGSMWFGSRIDKRKDPLRVYAWLEIGIGASAILLPFALAALNPVYRFLYNKTGASNYALSLVRFILSVAVLIVPTTLMGATLPVLSKFVVRRHEQTGARIGSLYAINTLGAVTGSFLAGFLLLGWLGMTHSELMAASINIFVGGMALGLSRRLGYTPPAEEELESKSVEQTKQYAPSTLTLVLWIFGFSGMAALGYEVLWSRILVFLLGSSIYSFSMILMVYLLGLTAGSFVMARTVGKLKRPLYTFGWLEIFIGLTVLCGLAMFSHLPFLPYSLKVNTPIYLARNLVSTFIVVLPPTLLMGAIFPVAVKVYARSLGAIGRQTGTIYAVNTVGAIIGSFVTGFILIPLAGSKDSVLMLILISISCGFTLLMLAMKEERAHAANWATLALLALPIAGFPFGNNLMRELSVRQLEQRAKRHWNVIAFDEDATAAVAVAEDEKGTRLLIVNGISMTFQSIETQLMAHLPLALQRDPKNVLAVCFGMGTTFVSAKSSGMDVDFVELCPYVVEAFEYYQKQPSLLNEPGVGKIIADGRNYLLLSDKKYDLVTIDPPPPPYSAGTVNLYTKEFYQLCQQRLTPEGIVCQWIPMYSTTEEQYKMLLRTFMEVFPHTTVWGAFNKVGTYWIGTPERMRLDKNLFYAYFDRQSVRKDIALYMTDAIDGPRVLSLMLLNEDAARNYVEGAPVMRDDLPLIEFPLFRSNPESEMMNIGLIESRH